MISLDMQGRTFILKEAGEVVVIGEGNAKVSYFTGSVVSRDDLYIWALGYLSGKDNTGWGGLV